ncbi:MAG: tetratricopeptide repeat protein [Polyangiaceae bacterium]
MPRKRDTPPEVTSNVIHVAFGAGGGRLRTEDLPPAPLAPDAGSTALEPTLDLYTAPEVAKLLGVPTHRLRALDKANIVSPSGSRGGKRAYTFSDLIALRATAELLRQQIRMRDVARAISALKKTLPRVTRPLQELRIVSDGTRVVVRAEEGPFEPLTGQMVLDFRVGTLESDVVHVLRPASADAQARTAYDLYVRASALDENPLHFDEAEALYRRAIEFDPRLAIAYTNLGNIRFRRGDERGAEDLYLTALSIDGRQPEAHYNLGYLSLETGNYDRAVDHLTRALETDPKFADAHFNLAMAHEALGDRTRAKRHWKRYLELDPEGTWADVAREHLK